MPEQTVEVRVPTAVNQHRHYHTQVEQTVDVEARAHVAPGPPPGDARALAARDLRARGHADAQAVAARDPPPGWLPWSDVGGRAAPCVDCCLAWAGRSARPAFGLGGSHGPSGRAAAMAHRSGGAVMSAVALGGVALSRRRWVQGRRGGPWASE
eukprot:11691342-Alexandrium_andersonii.AAC.1